ncbi:CRISPR-associated helicase Cas3' [Amycolatopsis sp. NPDC049868]|uniref:CRISPR-associated helicase Cas3' n=1 Tax=Amycolatopsis sp. NPDC049868 TaxID=3363934 RepID=UPI0037B3B510
MIHGDVKSSVWAKSDRDENGIVVGWLPLHQHLDDTMSVARLLVDHWVSPLVKATIERDVPDSEAGVRIITCWLAGVHDIGKASPAFACQVDVLADRMRDDGFAMHPRLVDDPNRRAVGHALAGHWAVRDWLTDEAGFDFASNAAQWASVVGSHHGVTPEESQLAVVDSSSHLTGSNVWETTRRSLLARATKHSGGLDAIRGHAQTSLSLPTQVLLTAIVIVADWIASNSELFPLLPLSTTDFEASDSVTADRAKTAWATLNLPSTWAPERFDGDVDQFFRDRFHLDAGARPVQAATVAAAVAQTEPGMLIVEAPMGAGKTEAALLAAEVLAYRSGANGVFVALPTQATTDAMYDRIRAWLNRMPSPHQLGLNLAHGKAHLNDKHAGLVRSGRFAAVGEEAESVVAHWWLSGRKKAGLASFVVGTIDQVLFGALKSRHLMLRHLALAGKVVVIDEVHAYDVYMSQYLHRALHWLGAYRVPVVLLSATLPDERRAELLSAYDSGRGIREEPPAEHPGYPVVCGTGGLTPRAIELVDSSTEVALDHLDDDLDTLITYLRWHLRDGGCAVVVRNTVARVQETAGRLAAEFGTDTVTISHSRFLACDRARIDADLVRRFGPPESAPDRPALHIVVASQVVEQSLDVDFDLLVTDLAPADLVLQRLGRSHRHRRSRPAGVETARCALVGVDDWAATPVTAVPGSRRVYGEHTLLRSAALLVDRGSLRLPDDIAPLVQQAYSDRPLGPPSWRDRMQVAATSADTRSRRRVDRAQTFLLGEVTASDTLVGWLRAGVGDVHEDNPQGAAQVRDGAESLEVLVVQKDADGGILTPSWIPGGRQQIPLTEVVPIAQAKVIAACALRLPVALSHGGVIDAVIAELEQHHFSSFDQNPWLKGQLVLPFDEHRRAELHGYTLTYDLRRGLMHERI